MFAISVMGEFFKQADGVEASVFLVTCVCTAFLSSDAEPTVDSFSDEIKVAGSRRHTHCKIH